MIDELATSVDGDPHQQFVEIRTLVAGQTHTTGTVLGAFDAAGTYLGDVLVVDRDVESPAGRWLLATTEFQARHGLVADFTFPAGRLPVSAGMVCWGAPIRGERPLDPPGWDHADFSFYTDCVAYGAYCGHAPGGAAVGAVPADHSLARVGGRALDDDFACSRTMTPTNNAGAGLVLNGTPCTPLPATLCGEVVTGGSPRRSDCWGEWVVRGMSGARPIVVCKDGSAECDGSRSGGCLVRVQLCFDDVLNARYDGRCPLVRLQRFALRVRQRDGVDRDNVQTILAAVRGLGGEVSGTTASLPDVRTPTCTPLFELVVPLETRRARRVAGRRSFKSSVGARALDRDRLTLVCQP